MSRMLCGNDVGYELLLSFFIGGLGSWYWFSRELPSVFERWPCCGYCGYV